jgi:hypothetical protein
MNTTTSKLGRLIAVVALGGALTGCDGGIYDTTVVRLDGRPGSASQAGSASALAANPGDQAQAAGSPYAAAYAQAQLTPPPAPEPTAYSNSYAPPPAPVTVDDRGNLTPVPAAALADPAARVPPAATNLRPVIARVSPQAGAPEGGNELTIVGSDFANVQVMVGGQVARVTSQSSNAVTVLAPEGQHGPATVVVTNRDGTYSVAGGAYKYM